LATERNIDYTPSHDSQVALQAYCLRKGIPCPGLGPDAAPMYHPGPVPQPLVDLPPQQMPPPGGMMPPPAGGPPAYMPPPGGMMPPPAYAPQPNLDMPPPNLDMPPPNSMYPPMNPQEMHPPAYGAPMTGPPMDQNQVDKQNQGDPVYNAGGNAPQVPDVDDFQARIDALKNQ